MLQGEEVFIQHRNFIESLCWISCHAVLDPIIDSSSYVCLYDSQYGGSGVEAADDLRHNLLRPRGFSVQFSATLQVSLSLPSNLHNCSVLFRWYDPGCLLQADSRHDFPVSTKMVVLAGDDGCGSCPNCPLRGGRSCVSGQYLPLLSGAENLLPEPPHQQCFQQVL